MDKCDFRVCKKTAKYHISYDCGKESQVLELCLDHYNSDPVFQRRIKIIQEINSK